MILALHMETVNCFNSPKSITCSSPVAFRVILTQHLQISPHTPNSSYVFLAPEHGKGGPWSAVQCHCWDVCWDSNMLVPRLADQLETLAPLCRSWATQVCTPVIFLGQESILAFWNMVNIFKLIFTNWHGVAHEGWMWEKRAADSQGSQNEELDGKEPSNWRGKEPSPHPTHFAD